MSNLITLFKTRFKKDDLINYTDYVIKITLDRISDKLTAEELVLKMTARINKFLKDYGKL